MIKKINLFQQFTLADKAKTGTCNRIEMTYILMEVCGLTEDEKEIMLTLCDQPSKDVFIYQSINEHLNQIDIEHSGKITTDASLKNFIGNFRV